MFLKLVRMFLLVCLLGTLSGCDELRTKLANVLQPETPQQTLAIVEDLISSGNAKLVISKGEKLAETSGPLQGKFSWSIARAYAIEGDIEKALKHLQTAVSQLNLTSTEVMNEKDFDAIKSNVRFLQIITDTSSLQQNSSGSSAQSTSQTSIKMDGNGTEVRAGNIVLKLPN